MLLAGFATIASVTKISLDAFFPSRPRLGWKLLTATAPAAAIATTPAMMQAQQLEWTPMTFTTDAGEVTEAERAVITVPAHHANPSGPTIKLPMIRFRSTAANAGPPLIYLAGGPGNSGLSAAKRDQYFPGLTAFREVGDVIVFDQRGTGASEPSVALEGRFALASDEPIGSPNARAAFKATAEKAVQAMRDKGVDLSAYNTRESADDVEAIRKAIGADKINLWGHSYGSHLGLAYIKQHGSHVGRAIFGGINGLDHRWRYPSEGQTWLESIDAATKQDPRLRAVMPDFLGTTRNVIAKLAANPARVTIDGREVLIGADEVRTMFVLQGGESDFVKRLPMIVADMERGNYAPYAGAVQGILRNRPLGTAMSYVMHIASGVSETRQSRITREAPGTILGDAINYPFSDAGFRTAWGVPDLGDTFRSPVRSQVPTLFISGTLDGRTSVAAANEVRQGFANGVQVILRNAAHDVYGESPALMNVMSRFLKGTRVRDTAITFPIEFHGPDEQKLTAELHSIALAKTPAAAIARAKEMRATGSGQNLTSYVLVNVATMLDRTDKRPADAIEILRGATAMFPDVPVLYSRLGGALLAAGDRAGAATAYRTALKMNPFLRFSAVQLAKLDTSR